MEKYQQVHTGGERDVKSKIVGFSLHKLESEFPSMYGFMVGLNWFTNRPSSGIPSKCYIYRYSRHLTSPLEHDANLNKGYLVVFNLSLIHI